MKTILVTLAFASAAIVCSAQQVKLNRTLYFNSAKSDVGATDLHWIDSLGNVLKNIPSAKVEIKAYCDADGAEEANARLAKARAASVRAAFTNSNIPEAAITISSFGENDPVADNASAEGKAKNRRVVVSVVYEKKKVLAVIPKKETTLASANLKVGNKLVLKNLNFEGGTDVLLPASNPVLKELLQLMNDHPTLKVEIGGHVCCGPAMELSIMRAKKVYDYLVANNISKVRMTYKGYSFDKPIADDRTEDGKTLNRRVEITVMQL